MLTGFVSRKSADSWQWRMEMGWILVGIIGFLLALVFKMSLLLYAIYTLAGIALLSRWLSRTWAGGLQAERRCRQLTAEIGDRIPVEIVVKNTGSLPVLWMLVEDLLPRDAMLYKPPKLGVHGSRIAVAKINGKSEYRMMYYLECNRRGYFQIGPLVLETGDLFGLHRRFKVLSKPNYVLVLPQPVPLTGYDVASRRPIGEVTMTYRIFEDPTRIAGVREYQRGDSMNRINWKATARTGELQSKVCEPSTVIGATILVDFHRKAFPRQYEPYRSEIAITAAASIANTVYHMNQQIGLISNGRDAADRIRTEGWVGDSRTRNEAKASAEMQEESGRLRPVVVETRRGVEQLQRIFEALARLEKTSGLDLARLVSEAADRLPRDATVIAILSRVTDVEVVALTSLRNQGYAVTAVINCHNIEEFAANSGPLIAEGIETRHLKDEESISEICKKQAVAAAK
ncbi:MAG: DUF58 domain-containing protein [Planctomycetota bacterium]|nr:DUF58 domain-containing protein [Planctomycetota bacterium]